MNIDHSIFAGIGSVICFIFAGLGCIQKSPYWGWFLFVGLLAALAAR